MEQFQIRTAQNVSVNHNIADIKERIFAFFIDSFIRVIYLILLGVLASKLDSDDQIVLATLIFLSLPAMLYHLILESLMNGTTIGKSAMKIKVAKLDGSKPTFANYFVRWLLRLFEISIGSGAIALVTILIKGTGQRIGDLAAGTTVISEKKKVTLNDTLLRELPLDYQPTFTQVTLFKDSEMQTIKVMYDKAVKEKNFKIINRLSDRIKEVTGISTNILPVQFVDIVIKDYNFYTQNT